MNKDIKRQRVENYFIDSLCDIIKEEGMAAATIRNVADKAGYNSATLYTYFKNFSHLLMAAHLRLEDEMLDIMIQKAEKINNGAPLDIWIKGYLFMAEYYICNPNVFDCIFVLKYEGGDSEELQNLHREKSNLIKYASGLQLKICEQSKLPLIIIQNIHNACLAQIVGSVLLVSKERCNQEQSFFDNLESQLRFIVNGCISKMLEDANNE